MKQMMNEPLAGCLSSTRLAKKPSHDPALPIIISFAPSWCKCWCELGPCALGGRCTSSKGEVLLNSSNYPHFWISSLPLLTTSPASSTLQHLVPVAEGGMARWVFGVWGAVVGLC